MRPGGEPLQIPAGEFASYPSDGRHPYELFEIYNNTDGTQDAALITWISFQNYLSSRLRWRKRRKFIEAHGASILEETVRRRFPTGRYVDTDEGALCECAIALPAGVQRMPVEVEERLLQETYAGDVFHQVNTSDSPLNRELRQRFRLVSVGSEWQKYFSDRVK